MTSFNCVNYKIINELYRNGKFYECINNLKLLNETSCSVLDGIILKNNTLVCEALISLSSKEGQEKIDFAQNCDNIYAIDSVNPIPVEDYLLVEFNYLWWIILTHQLSSDYSIGPLLYDNVTGLVEKTYIKVLGIDSRIQTSKINSQKLCYEIIKILQKLLVTAPAAIGIYLELTTAILFLCTLLKRIEEDDLCKVIQSILRYKRELTSVSEVACQEQNKFYFKFGTKQCNSYFAEINTEDTLDLLAILFQYFNESGFTVSEKSNQFSMWIYCKLARLMRSREYEKSLGISFYGLSKCDDSYMRNRFRKALAQIYYRTGDYEKSLEQLKEISDDFSPDFYYLLGLVHGRMGMYDFMVKHFETLLKMTKQNGGKEDVRTSAIQILMNIVHPRDELTKTEALYLLATAYSFHESFDDASAAYDNLLAPKKLSSLNALRSQQNRLLKIPRLSTLFHDAAVTKLLIGDFEKAEYFCVQAIEIYNRQTAEYSEPDPIGLKDNHWIENMINQDLNQLQAEPKKSVTFYYEDHITEFSNDVIGYLIHAELLQLQGATEEHRSLLTQSLLQLSKYIAQRQDEKSLRELELKRLTLVKALTSRTCLNIARLNAETKPFAEVDRMFKRALVCNKGNRDVFYHYAAYLKKEDKAYEAVKLWKTFASSEAIIEENQCQSVALRYLLRTQVTKTKINELKISLNL